MKLPIKLRDQDVQIQIFSDESEQIVMVGTDPFRVRMLPNDEAYFMVKIRGQQRTIRGPYQKVLEAVVRCWDVYKRYENVVRKSKENAQMTRDKDLNEIAESV